MKTGNLLSLIFIVFLFAGAVICDLLLAAQYRKTDLTDPYKNFETIPVGFCKKLSIAGGNGYAIQLKAGKLFSVRLMKSRKSFFAVRQFGDSLVMSFRVANQTYQRPEDCTVGLIVTAPDLSSLKLCGVNTALSGFTVNSIRIDLDSAAQTRCSNLHIDNLIVQARRGATIDFQQHNLANSFSIQLSSHASATLDQIEYKNLHQEISDSASIRFYKNSLEQLLSYSQRFTH